MKHPKLFCGIMSAVYLCSTAQIFAQSLAIDSLSGAITQNEIDSFKSYMLTQVPPPTPWGALNGTGHNAWCDGAGGNNLEAFGLMYEATGDIGILTNMIFWTDTAVSERNDLMSAANGGQRVCWDGIIDHIWVAQDLATTDPSTGCETGDAQGHITYTAKLILQNPSLWNTTVPDGDPFGYGTTYLDRAKTYIAKCDDANSQYLLKYFVQSGTDLIRDPTDPRWKGLSTPNNRQSMFYVGWKRLAECHEILGDNPSLVAQYDAIVQAASGECINGMAGYHPTTVNGDTVYDWGYYPFDVYPAHTENVGHGAYDIYGIYNAYTRSAYGYPLSKVKPFANALIDVMNIAPNSFSGAVDGTGTAQNDMQQQWVMLADMRASVYDVVAQADLTSTRYKTSPYMTAAILWMKNRRLLEFSVAATPSSQTVTAGSGTSYSVSLSPLAGFTGTVSLSVSGLPSGASASFSPGSVNMSTISSFFANSTLSVNTASSTPAGTYTLKITGTSGSVTHSANVSLTVNTGVNLSGIYQLQNEASGLVLNNQGSLTNGSPITQWTSVTSSNLEWTFIATSNGYYQINSYRSGKDAVVQGASTANGAGIVQWSFGSSGDDQWKPVANSDGSYTFFNLHSGLVLDDPASSTNKTTQMDQWTSNGGANQKWNLLKQ